MPNTSARAVAAEIRTRLPGVPTKKLHKLLYYAQAHHLAAFAVPLFSESVSAWDMGPVVAQLWWSEKNGSGTPSESVQLGEVELNTIGYVVSRYGKLSDSELQRLTHSESPWIEADQERQRTGQQSERITLKSIMNYFREQAQSDEDELLVDMAAHAALIKGAARRETEAVPIDDTPESLLARLR